MIFKTPAGRSFLRSPAMAFEVGKFLLCVLTAASETSKAAMISNPADRKPWSRPPAPENRLIIFGSRLRALCLARVRIWARVERPLILFFIGATAGLHNTGKCYTDAVQREMPQKGDFLDRTGSPRWQQFQKRGCE